MKKSAILVSAISLAFAGSAFATPPRPLTPLAPAAMPLRKVWSVEIL